MQDFVDKLNVYLVKNEQGRLLGPWIEKSPRGDHLYVAFLKPHGRFWDTFIVTDSEDFEQQVYKGIKKCIKHE